MRHLASWLRAALYLRCRRRIGSGDNGRLTYATPMAISSNSRKTCASHDGHALVAPAFIGALFFDFRLGKNHRDPKTGSWGNLLLRRVAQDRLSYLGVSLDVPSTCKDWSEKDSGTHI